MVDDYIMAGTAAVATASVVIFGVTWKQDNRLERTTNIALIA